MKQTRKTKTGSIFILLIFLVSIPLPQQTLEAQSQLELNSPIKNKVFTYDPKQDPQIVEGEVIIKYKKKNIDLSNEIGAKKADNFQKTKNLENIDEVKDQNIRLVKTKKTTAQTIEDLKNDPDVEYAQPNFKKFPAITNVNDPVFPQQWDLSKIQAPLAWDNELPTDADVTVAVIDTGVYYNHEDLLQNLWNGSASCKDAIGATIPGGCPYHGWDFLDNDSDPMPNGTQQTDPHGTWVSGIMAATTNNITGISGMSRNNHIKIMALRFGLDTISEIKSISFAKNNGAKIINASFGGPGFDQAEKDAITSFPGIFVAAAGNNGTDNETAHDYPSDYDNANIISVAATDQNDALASFSNYGATSVDIAAPGVAIPTTYYSSNNDYASVDGTSFAAPLVAGAVAMLESKNPILTDAQIKNAVLASGDQIAKNDRAKIVSGRRLNLNNNYLLGVRAAIPIPSVAGGSYIANQSVSLSSATDGAAIYYTLNGSTPSSSSTPYTSPISISSTTTLKVVAIKATMINSDIMDETYTFNVPIPVYRFFNKIKGNHFYTTNTNERDDIIKNLYNEWDYEGISYQAYEKTADGLFPVYRFWNKKNGFHFYTQSESERSNIKNNLSDTWNDESIAYYAYSSNQPGTTPLFRFFNKLKGNHFYTTNASERDNIKNNLSNKWNDEGTAWYVTSN